MNAGCVGLDPTCPCQDGECCHYRDCGDSPAEVSFALMSACEALVLRALERAGNKRRTRTDNARLAHIPDHETHLHLPVERADVSRLLERAWTLAPSIASLHEVDPSLLAQALHGFTADLLAEAAPYGGSERTRLCLALAQVVTATTPAHVPITGVLR